MLLGLIAQALGAYPHPVTEPPGAAAARWDELVELAADPRSGLAVRGKPPV